MQTRKLGRHGATVSAIGLGCMRMSNMMQEKQPAPEADVESVATIEAALDAGITFLNTGDFYGVGHNETLVAKAIERRRDQAFISVKFGAQVSPSGKILGIDGRPNSVKSFASYSLRRLGVDYIDLYQPARADPTVPYEDTIGAVADLIKEGKVRHLGVSEIDANLLRRAHRVHPVTALEIEYSLACRFIEDEILPTARELEIGLVAYSVVTQGLLTGSMKQGLAPGGVTAAFPRFQGENLTKNLETVSFLEQMAQAKGLTPAQLAIAWVLAQGDDIVPLVGMSRRSHLPENLRALDVVFERDDLAALDRAFAPGAIVGDRYPTGRGVTSKA
jgi:aryl-alcohol dehydrogenase-like predicted oxidoreductase